MVWKLGWRVLALIMAQWEPEWSKAQLKALQKKVHILLYLWCNAICACPFASGVSMCVLNVSISKYSKVGMTNQNIPNEAQHKKGSCFSACFFLGHEWPAWRCQYPASVSLFCQMSWGEIRGFMQLGKKTTTTYLYCGFYCVSRKISGMPRQTECYQNVSLVLCLPKLSKEFSNILEINSFI